MDVETFRNAVTALVGLALAGCGPVGSDQVSPAASRSATPLRVVATTGMVGDMVRQIGGDRVDLIVLMGPGVDPHLYKATASDVSALQGAGAVFYSGLHLEGRMSDLLGSMARSGRRVMAVAEVLPQDRLLPADDSGKTHDPHVWFDVALWAQAVGPVAEALAAADPEGAQGYQERAVALQGALERLDAWVRATLADIPPERRVLVTSHDAFGYFGRAYGFRVVGLQGISTVTEAGLADMTQLADFIRSNRLPAIFVESSVSHAALERIAADTGVRIGGELFSDALGTPGRIEEGYDVGTYEGMIRHNVNTLVRALR